MDCAACCILVHSAFQVVSCCIHLCHCAIGIGNNWIHFAAAKGTWIAYTHQELIPSNLPFRCLDRAFCYIVQFETIGKNILLHSWSSTSLSSGESVCTQRRNHSFDWSVPFPHMSHATCLLLISVCLFPPPTNQTPPCKDHTGSKEKPGPRHLAFFSVFFSLKHQWLVWRWRAVRSYYFTVHIGCSHFFCVEHRHTPGLWVLGLARRLKHWCARLDTGIYSGFTYMYISRILHTSILYYTRVYTGLYWWCSAEPNGKWVGFCLCHFWHFALSSEKCEPVSNGPLCRVCALCGQYCDLWHSRYCALCSNSQPAFCYPVTRLRPRTYFTASLSVLTELSKWVFSFFFQCDNSGCDTGYIGWRWTR